VKNLNKKEPEEGSYSAEDKARNEDFLALSSVEQLPSSGFFLFKFFSL
jgi:hypothetical protein